jgi:hypothetical protein
MKCPYTCNIKQTNLNKFSYDEDGKQNEHKHQLIENREFVECLKEDCGAYYNGKCNYAAISLNN